MVIKNTSNKIRRKEKDETKEGGNQIRSDLRKVLPDGSVPSTAAALPFWMAIDSLCLRNAVDRTSPVHLCTLPPISPHMSMAAGPHAPRVSMAMGTNS